MKMYTVHGHVARHDGTSHSFWTRTGLSKSAAEKLARDQRAESGGVARVAAEDAGGAKSSVSHARKKTVAQLNREIAEALAQGSGQIKLKDRYSGGHAWLNIRDGRVVGAMGSDPKRYVGMSFDEARHHARYGGRPKRAHATKRSVEVDTSVYRRYHGAEPRGSGNWTFVIGKPSYEHSDDPALYRPAVARGVYKGGQPQMSFAKAKEHAIAEAKRRGATVVGVGP